MNEELQAAYNEWLLKFGFKPVQYHELHDNMWGMFDLLRHHHLQYTYDESLDETYHQLTQPHEILDTET